MILLYVGLNLSSQIRMTKTMIFRSLDEQINHLTSLENVTTNVQQSLSRNKVRPSSPVPRDPYIVV